MKSRALAGGRGMWQDTVMAKKTDIQIVKGILDEMEGQKNQMKADRIVRVLGKRIRQRHRDRDREAMNQAAQGEA